MKETLACLAKNRKITKSDGENNYKLLKFTNIREFLINELKYAFRQATLECEKGYLS